jgi:lambda repressor-like predicted transcriptional regulator
MTNQQIIDLYDTNPNITLAELSKITGLSVQQLKNILVGQA